MRECKVSSRRFYYFLTFYLGVVLALIFYIPFTQVEYHLLQKEQFLTTILAKEVYSFFNNYIILRLVFFSISLLSLYLLKKVAFFYLNKSFAYLSLILYLLTPGVFVSFIIANFATLPLFLTLLFVYSYMNKNILFQLLSLVLLFFTNTPIFIFYFAVSSYAFYKKDWQLFILGAILFIISAITSTYYIGGIPKGYIVELFINYAIIFSPFYFIAILYTIYRLARDKNLSLIWYISTFFLVVSILLSIRQKVKVTEFAPFIVIISPLVVMVFKNSISIRLKQFQKWHLRVCKIVLLILFIEVSLIALSYPIYQLSSHKIKIINSKIYTIKK